MFGYKMGLLNFTPVLWSVPQQSAVLVFPDLPSRQVGKETSQ